ncbi:DsbA family oxidoreductase [Isoptericola jiangsuensis]|uniref:DsbA family oxidoreductase n=1 Tax=Isoptericola jiangsuensis TaxID=548579 RepID=UPI003AAD8820
MTTVHVDIWSDIACPFCYIGKRNFESAVAASDLDVEVTYRSFQLSPDMPDDAAGSHAEMLAAKMGVGVEEARGMEARTAGLAEQVGLDFDYDAVHPANTLAAHRLLHLAKAHGRQGEMKERLMAAYFADGRHVGRTEELVEIAGEVGLDPDVVREALDSGAYADDVAQDVARAAAYGIRGVPFFVLDARLAVSGAQPPEVFAQALAQAAGEEDAA